MVTPSGPSLDPSKLINFIILDYLWVYEDLGDILSGIVSNSHFGQRPEDRDMTIFASHASPHNPSIGYMEVYALIPKLDNQRGTSLHAFCNRLDGFLLALRVTPSHHALISNSLHYI